MKIAFATTQSLRGSTNVGRIMPLAQELEKLGHECHVLVLKTTPSLHKLGAPLLQEGKIHTIGNEPFRRTTGDKKRLRGIRLAMNMLDTALRTAWTLHKLQPDIIVISKPLPANTLGVWIYVRWRRLYNLSPINYKLILDADDFELTANKLSSIAQRAVIHWSERTASGIANAVVVASPFLADHFKQLTQNTKPIELIPTGIETTFLPVLREGGLALAGSEGSKGRLLLAYIGSVSISSGHRVDFLPEIVAKLIVINPTVHLLIAGDGDDVNNLKQEFQRRGLRQHVTWHGRFTLSEVEGLLPLNTIVIDPVDDSIANRAKSSWRVMLASSLGLPVVTSNIGIRPELLPVSFHDRFFAEPGQPDSYTEKIDWLRQHPLASTEREELREHATQFTWGRLAERYHEILTL